MVLSIIAKWLIQYLEVMSSLKNGINLYYDENKKTVYLLF